MKKFGPNELDLLRKELESALKQIGEKHGVKFKLGAMRYPREGTDFKAQLEAEPSEDSPEKEAKNKTLARLFDLPEDIFGKQIRSRERGMCKIVGIDPKRPKFCVIAENAAGVPILFTADSVRAQLGPGKKLGLARSPVADAPVKYDGQLVEIVGVMPYQTGRAHSYKNGTEVVVIGGEGVGKEIYRGSPSGVKLLQNTLIRRDIPTTSVLMMGSLPGVWSDQLDQFLKANGSSMGSERQFPMFVWNGMKIYPSRGNKYLLLTIFAAESEEHKARKVQITFGKQYPTEEIKRRLNELTK